MANKKSHSITVLTIKAPEKEVIDTMNLYLNQKDSFWYKNELSFHNVTTEYDKLNGYSTLRIAHPKKYNLADKIDCINGLEFFLQII